MVLTNEKAKLFYELWIPLLDYVNKKHHLIKSLYGMTDSHGLPLESVHVISCKLWEDVSVIEEYLNKKSEMLPEHKETIREWKKAVRGRFVVDRHLKIGSVLVSCEDNSVYIVSGICSSWREMLEGYPVPQIVEATLIPYDGKIICDGIVQPYGICLGKNMADEVQRLYRTAKESGNLIKTL